MRNSPPNQTELIHRAPWDTLIILDACTDRAFREVYPNFLIGKYQTAYSPASCTRDWLRRTWRDKDYSDITYISCNVFMQRQTKKHIWQYPHPERFKKVIDVWREGLMPWHIEKHALVTSGRKVLHYMFPHQPYYGEEKDCIYEGHRDNLIYVMPYLQKLLLKLQGKNIITSDHGELFRPGLAYHPCMKENEQLRHVPWFLYEKIKSIETKD